MSDLFSYPSCPAKTSESDFFFKRKKKKKILNVIYFIFQINWRIKCSFVGSENVSFFLN